MNNWYSLVYKALIYVSAILFLISFGTSGNTTIGAVITGYSALTLSILMILIMLLNNVMNTTAGKPTMEIIKTILMAAGPFLLMLAVIGLILYLVITYSKIIADGHVANGYYTFSNISIILFLLQIYLLYGNMDTEQFKQTHKLSSITSSLIYLLGVISTMTALILYTILKYFTTDGFSTLSKG
jgi:hypothetical protein